MTPSAAGSERDQAAELLGKLAREAATLVQRDREVVLADRLPQLRNGIRHLTATIAAAVAAAFALGALTWAAGRALGTVLPAWAAPLPPAFLWALAAAAAWQLRRPARREEQARQEELVDDPIRLLTDDRQLHALTESRRQAQEQAEDEVRATAQAFVEALMREAARRNVEKLPELLKQQAADAPDEAPQLVSDLLTLLTAPARASVDLLGRLADQRQRDK